jgi:hypothetical protein
MLYTHDNFISKDISNINNYNWLKFFEIYDSSYIKNRLVVNDSFDNDIYELLKLMLHKLHVYRISIHGLKKHTLLQNLEN